MGGEMDLEDVNSS